MIRLHTIHGFHRDVDLKKGLHDSLSVVSFIIVIRFDKLNEMN